MVIRFELFEVDTERFELRRGGELVHVEPKVFHLIAHLADNADRVISVEELIEVVWSSRVVSDTTVAGCIKHARKALGDSGDAQRLIKTVRGRGFRFIGDVNSDDLPKIVAKTSANNCAGDCPRSLPMHRAICPRRVANYR